MKRICLLICAAAVLCSLGLSACHMDGSHAADGETREYTQNFQAEESAQTEKEGDPAEDQDDCPGDDCPDGDCPDGNEDKRPGGKDGKCPHGGDGRNKKAKPMIPRVGRKGKRRARPMLPPPADGQTP